jgi:FMN phosphatase YigB (HAD superfamily)
LLHAEPRLSRLEFSVASSRVIARHHEAARARGVPWPEVHWPSVVAEVLPELTRLPRPAQEEFVCRHIQTGHATWLAPGTVETLRGLRERRVLLGIASNAQAYTLGELDDALAPQALGLDLFERDLCFWSFAHGFSKPDPHVFQILTARLAARGIAPHETLMVGDRLDNDLEPARAHGWQAWEVGTAGERDWAGLRARWAPGRSAGEEAANPNPPSQP